MRRFSLALVLLFTMASPAQADDPGITLSPPETVYGPHLRYPDAPVFTLGNRLYIANGYTFIFNDFQNPVIGPGSEWLAFDRCGAWLMSAYEDGGVVRGWYHGEAIVPPGHCNRKTIAYAESYDGGVTFVKPGYPGNQIISAPPIPNVDFDDEGDFHVIRRDGYYYLYFLTSRDVRVHLARSPIASGGGPGTWLKWYNGDFTEPGLGGQSDPIAERWELQLTWVSWNSYLNQWTGFHRRADGWGLSVSKDGLHWVPVDCTIIQAGFVLGSKPLVDYFSIVGLDGSSEQAGQEFWLYYMLIRPYDTLDHRLLLRRRVTLGEGGECESREAPLYLPVVGK